MAERKKRKKGDTQAQRADRTLQIPYVLASHHRVICADDVTVNSKTDALGTTLELRFTWLETVPTGERVRVETKGGVTRQVAPAEFTGTEPRKTVEVDVLMRPDHALGVAKAILTRLQALNPAQRKRYRIPVIKKIVV